MAARGFRRDPTFAATTVLILGLAIGMAVAMMTVVDAVLLRRLPVRDQDRIVLPRVVDRVGVAVDLMPDQLERLRQDTRAMSDVAGIAHSDAIDVPLRDGDRAIVLRRAFVTGGYFSVLGARAMLGRAFGPEDDVAGAAPTMVLSFAAWQSRFGGDSSVVGRHLAAPWSPAGITIIGVAAPGLDFPSGTEAWLPMGPFGTGMVSAIARLRPNATATAAATEVLGIMRRDAQSASWVPTAHAEVHTLTDAVVGEIRPVLVVLLSAVGLLLLVACVNVGSLLLLRAATRTRELAIRRALGATRGAIVSQLLVESALIGVCGGLLGFACAAGLRRALLAFAPPGLPRIDMIGLAATPLGAALGVTGVAVLVFGIAPAVAALRGSAVDSRLRLGVRAGSTRGRRRVRRALVATQVAMAVVMLAAAGLLVRTLERLTRVDLGYQAEHLGFLWMSLPPEQYGPQPAAKRFYDRIAPGLQAVAGVTSITPVTAPPFQLPNMFLMKLVPMEQSGTRDEYPIFPVEIGGPDYFRTLGIPLLRGRGFTAGDDENAPSVVVISEGAAKVFWPGEDPVGKRLVAPGDTSGDYATVIGLAPDIRFRRLRQAMPTMYRPWKQFAWFGSVAVRSTVPLSALLPAMRRVVHDADPSVDLWWASSTDDILDGPLAQPRMGAVVLSGFALVALLLAGIGLYSAMASTVREQSRDLGVRMALGATGERLWRGVLKQALRTAGIGLAVGIVVALAGSRLLRGLLFEISPADPITIAGACIVLLVVVLVAAHIPARRATRVDPMEILRNE